MNQKRGKNTHKIHITTTVLRRRQERSASEGHSRTNFNNKSHIKVSEEGKGRVFESQRRRRGEGEGTVFKVFSLSVGKEGEAEGY